MRLPFQVALSRLESSVKPTNSESVSVGEAIGRVVRRTVRAVNPVPPQTTAFLDGYAVKAPLSEGSVLKVVEGSRKISEGEAVRVRCGDVLPEGANAVLPIEFSAGVGSEIRSLSGVKPWSGVRVSGADLGEGSVILREGDAVRPQLLKLLSEAGIEEVEVAEVPKVAIIPTGDEFAYGGVPEVVGKSLSALFEGLGSKVKYVGPAPDLAEAISTLVDEALLWADAVFLVGGSGKSWKDLSWRVRPSEGFTKLFRGLGIRPGVNTSAYTVAGKPVVILPGFHVAAYSAGVLVGSSVINKLLGRRATPSLKPLRLVKLIGKPRIVEGVLNLVFLKAFGLSYAESVSAGMFSLAPLAFGDGFTLLWPGYVGDVVVLYDLTPTVFDYLPARQGTS